MLLPDQAYKQTFKQGGCRAQAPFKLPSSGKLRPMLTAGYFRAGARKKHLAGSPLSA